MNKVLENKYPYLSNFFQTAVSKNRLFHSIILHGSNNFIQYAMALEIARQLNCLEDKREDCNCQNCRWIRENQHPAVMTISQIDNKNDDKKTVISKQQIDEVLDKIFASSEYHRVFIFCSAEIKELSQIEQIEEKEFSSTGFTAPQQGKDSKVWYPSGIKSCSLKFVSPLLQINLNTLYRAKGLPISIILLANEFKKSFCASILPRSPVTYPERYLKN